MKWSSDFLTGIEIVDQQHQHFVDLINDAAPVLGSGTKLTCQYTFCSVLTIPFVKKDVAQQSINQLLYPLDFLLSQDNMEASKVFGQLQHYLSEQEHEKPQLLAQQVNLYPFDLLGTFKSMIDEHQLILSKTSL